MHHHRGEVAQVGQLLFGLLNGDAFVGAQPGVLGGEVFHQIVVVRVDDLDVFQRQAQFVGPGPNLLGITEQNHIGHAAPQHNVGRGEDPVIAGLGHHDGAPIGTGKLLQLMLEHQRSDHLRAVHLQRIEQLFGVDMVGEEAPSNFDLARAGSQRAFQAEDSIRGGEGAHLGHPDRQIGVDARNQLQDRRRNLVTAHQQNASQLREGSRSMGQQQAWQQIGAIAGHDHCRFSR